MSLLNNVQESWVAISGHPKADDLVRPTQCRLSGVGDHQDYNNNG